MSSQEQRTRPIVSPSNGSRRFKRNKNYGWKLADPSDATQARRTLHLTAEGRFTAYRLKYGVES